MSDETVAIIHCIDIDVPSWKWGDVRKTSMKSNVEDVKAHISRHPGTYYLLCGVSSGNYKYDGFHGLMSASDTIFASGAVHQDDAIICLRNDRLGWCDLGDQLLSMGCKPFCTCGISSSDLAPDGITIDDKVSPPGIALRNVRFSENGMRRLSNAVRWKLLKAFSSESGISTPKNIVGMPQAISNGAVSGWWDDYEPIDRFGSWCLAKADVLLGDDRDENFSDALTMMADIGRIWRGILLEQGKHPSSLELTLSNIDRISEQASVREGVRAYLRGVPVEDVLA